MTQRISDNDLKILTELEKKVLWLSSWTIHHANHLRDSGDGLKVGGHQASSASLAAIMTALYFHVLRPQDRVAVKPHASPNFHAIEYLLGKQTREKLEGFRGYKGAQSYPADRTPSTGVPAAEIPDRIRALGDVALARTVIAFDGVAAPSTLHFLPTAPPPPGASPGAPPGASPGASPGGLSGRRRGCRQGRCASPATCRRARGHARSLTGWCSGRMR